MLRMKPLFLGAAAIGAAIVLLGVIHHRKAGGRDKALEGARQKLAVGFLPVT